VHSNAAFKSSEEALIYEFERQFEMLLSDRNKMYFIFNFLTNTRSFLAEKKMCIKWREWWKCNFISTFNS